MNAPATTTTLRPTFAETPHIRKKLRQESIAKWFFAGMSLAMIIPLFLIVGHVVWEGWPSLSLAE